MRIIFSLLFLLVSAGLMAQDQTKEEPIVYSSNLHPGELVAFSNNALRFKEVISDSRCPKEVTCVWEGEAKVLVELFENGNFLEEKIIIVSNGNIPLNFSAKGILYTIQGMNLSPYPSAKQADPDYNLRITIVQKMI
ncbi:MAG TPA: hypothetical protein VK941_10150 [Gillisia sp.]|nr:hypothetical protein [Gillisia sp.]